MQLLPKLAACLFLGTVTALPKKDGPQHFLLDSHKHYLKDVLSVRDE
jgi:hypothetical protein